MRPLVPFGGHAKTALFFYSILAILIWLFLYLIPAQLFKSFSRSEISTKDQITKFVRNQRLFRDNWDQSLIETGLRAKSFSETVRVQLVKTEVNHQIFSWNSIKIEMMLPEVIGPGNSKQDLLKICALWKGLSQSSGQFISDRNFGYSHGCLWARLQSSTSINGLGTALVIPARQITLIQPLRLEKAGDKRPDMHLSIMGLVPSSHPRIPVWRFPQRVSQKGKKEKIKLSIPVFKAQASPRVAIIIDDIGYCSAPADEMLKVPAKLTWAILPFAPYTKKYLEAATNQGYEILLHLPLEAIDEHQNPGPGEIKREWTAEQVTNQLDMDLNSVPGAVGINNHMGSAGTRDRGLMQVLMRDIKNRHLFFVDSMTDAGSVAGEYAKEYQVPFARRKVFIDNQPDLDSKKEALRELIRLAKKDGAAIGIAHVRPGSATAIIDMLPEFTKAGVQIVPVSQLIEP